MKNNIFTYRIANSLYINLTNACPCSCTFCIRDTQKGIGYDLWLDKVATAEQVILEISTAKSWATEAVFCGYGEPTIQLTTLLQIAEFCKTINLPTRLNTNGLANLIHKRDVVGELFLAINSFSISLNAPNNVKYQELCHPSFGELASPAIINFTKQLVALGADVTLSVVDALNTQEIAECEQIATNLGAKFRVREL